MLAYQDDINHYVTLNSRFKNIKRDFKNSTDLRPICTDLRHFDYIVEFFEKVAQFYILYLSLQHEKNGNRLRKLLQ
jgi:hypothetical protein